MKNAPKLSDEDLREQARQFIDLIAEKCFAKYFPLEIGVRVPLSELFFRELQKVRNETNRAHSTRGFMPPTSVTDSD